MSDKNKKALKPGWRRVKFGDVVRQCKEKADPETSGLERYIAGDHMNTDDLRLRRWGEIGSGYLGPAFHMRFKPGQVLYGSRRTYLRKVAVADFDGICANTTFVLEPKNPDELLPEFLPFLMQADEFADRAFNAIAAGARHRVIPWQMGIVAGLLRMLPNALFDQLLAGRPRKQRQGEVQ